MKNKKITKITINFPPLHPRKARVRGRMIMTKTLKIKMNHQNQWRLEIVRLKIKENKKRINKTIKARLKLKPKNQKMKMYFYFYSGQRQKYYKSSWTLQKWKFSQHIRDNYPPAPSLHCYTPGLSSLLPDKSVQKIQPRRAERGRRKVRGECQKRCQHEYIKPQPDRRQKWDRKGVHEREKAGINSEQKWRGSQWK